jgi:hypothetical protein
MFNREQVKYRMYYHSYSDDSDYEGSWEEMIPDYDMPGAFND